MLSAITWYVLFSVIILKPFSFTPSSTMRLYVKMVVNESRHMLLPNMLVIPETFQICIASHIQMFFKLFCVETYMETSTPVFCLLTLEHSRWALKSRLFFRYADAILVSTLTYSSSCKMKMAHISVASCIWKLHFHLNQLQREKLRPRK